jgi:hypothetical protein
LRRFAAICNHPQPAPTKSLEIRRILNPADDSQSAGHPFKSGRRLQKHSRQAQTLIATLGIDMPIAPRYDSGRDERFPWEAQVIAAVKRLRKRQSASNDDH